MKKKHEIMITRPAWITETYQIELDEGEEIHNDVDSNTIRKWLEDLETDQLGTEISCHMDSSNAVGAEIHEDDFAEITINEIEEIV